MYGIYSSSLIFGYQGDNMSTVRGSFVLLIYGINWFRDISSIANLPFPESGRRQ